MFPVDVCVIPKGVCVCVICTDNIYLPRMRMSVLIHPAYVCALKCVLKDVSVSLSVCVSPCVDGQGRRDGRCREASSLTDTVDVWIHM